MRKKNGGSHTEEGYQEPYPKKRMKSIKQKQNMQKYTIAAVLLVLAGAAFLFSPVFSIQNIRAENASQFSTTELCEKIGLSQGENAILFSRTKAEHILEQEPYIEKARIVWELPNTYVIALTERKVRAYIPYMGSYLYIDEAGRVLDIRNTYVDGLPLVKGLLFTEFQKGDVLSVDNQEALEVVLHISQMIQKYELTEMVVEIDVSNVSDIYAQVNRVRVHLGDMDNMDQKIRNMAEIMKTIPKQDRGILDLSDLSKPMVFQYLT